MALPDGSSPQDVMAAARAREEAFLMAEHAANDQVRRAESRLTTAARELARAQVRHDRRAAEVAAARSTLLARQQARARGDEGGGELS